MRSPTGRNGGFGRGSEERRVGKECRSRWPPYHSKKKGTGEQHLDNDAGELNAEAVGGRAIAVEACYRATPLRRVDRFVGLQLSQDLFFFQAEDGIRDGHVTGVQTCALPILGASRSTTPSWASRYRPGAETM